jgi:hypothetical protein
MKKEKEIVCCFITGELGEYHHLLSRGAYPEFKDCEWNKLPLTRQLHREAHDIGLPAFVKKYNLTEEMLNRGFFFDSVKWRKHKE